MAKKDATAMEFGLKLLGISARTEAGLRQKMTDKGFDADEISEAMDHFKSRNFINDAEFAAKAVEKYAGDSHFSREMIRARLLEKGVPEAVIEKAVSGISDHDTAAAAFKARFGGAGKPENIIKLRQKAATYLQTKGFDYDIIEEILESEIKGGTSI
jgi:regulatory protein